jgi:hypothetical protein
MNQDKSPQSDQVKPSKTKISRGATIRTIKEESGASYSFSSESSLGKDNTNIDLQKSEQSAMKSSHMSTPSESSRGSQPSKRSKNLDFDMP